MRYLLLTLFITSIGNFYGQICEFKMHVNYNYSFGNALFEDFNNDGFIDIVSPESNGVYIIPGNGTGGINNFSNASSIGFPATVKRCLSSDFNNDGKRDLVIVCSNSISVFTGNGSFSFTPAFTATISSLGVVDAVVGDINNDGNSDFIIFGQGANLSHASVYQGQGNGSFTMSSSVQLSNKGFYFGLKDYNSDGLQDVISVMTSGSNANHVVLHYGTTTGSLIPGPIISYGLNWGCADLWTGDIDNDGFFDYALVASNTATNNVVIRYGLGNGNFAAPIILPDIDIASLLFDDMDGDGKMDLLYARNNHKEVAVRYFINTSNFSPPKYYFGRDPVYQVFAADIDNNGLKDLMLSTGVLLTQHIPKDFNGVSDFVTNSQYITSLEAYDSNGDGYSDIIGIDNDGIKTFTNTGSAQFGLANSYSLTGINFSHLKVNDMNMDGITDLIIFNQSSNILRIFYSSGTASFSNFTPLTFGYSVQGIDVADFNNDAKNDIVVVGQNGEITICLRGTGNNYSTNTFTVSGPNNSVLCYDYNLDGKTDIVVGGFGLKYFSGNGDGTFQNPVSINLPFNNSYNCKYLFADDYNQDNQMDIITMRSSGSGGAITVILGTAPGTFTSINSPLYNFPAGIGQVTAARLFDFNNDGKNDLLYSGGGLGCFIAGASPAGFPMGANVAGVVNSDFNNDGKQDICFSNIVGDGVISTALGQNLSNTTPVSAMHICSGTSATLTAGNSGQINWFNSPTSTISIGNSAQFVTPVLSTVNSPSIFTFYAENILCSTSYSRIAVTVTVDNCVWPGDANYDLIVDNLDLFPMGIHMGSNGNLRTNPTISWTGQQCINWGTNQNNGFDLKHADCDGNGNISLGDTLAISQNYSQTHPAKSPAINQSCQSNDIFLTFNKQIYFPGDTVICNVHLGSNNNIINCYGVAFDLIVNSNEVKNGSLKVNSLTSWLGNPIVERLNFNQINQTQQKVNSSQCRINGLNKNGYGPIMSYRFILKDTINASQAQLQIFNSIRIDSTGNILALSACSDTILIQPGIVGIKSFANKQNNIKLFPNPSSGKIQIEIENEIPLFYNLFTIDGKIIREKEVIINSEINLDEIDRGVYFLKIYKSDFTHSVHKVILERQ